jgi:hypothetical protein
MGFRTNKKGQKYPIGVGSSGNNNSPTNPRSKLTPQRRFELLNGINADKVSYSPVIKDFTELSDRRDSIMRSGVGSRKINEENQERKRSNAEILDRSQGHFIFLKDARKLE